MSRFVEKPDRETAQAYLDQGDYLWNSGIFVMKASIWLSALSMCRAGYSGRLRCVVAEPLVRTETLFGLIVRHLNNVLLTPSSYAVMEKLSVGGNALPKALVIPLSAGWSDVGAWDALWKVLPKCEAGNAVRGDVMLESCQDTAGRVRRAVGHLHWTQ